ncbi:hypothetical protein [Halobacillus sp. H74]|uniref:hypothetical protein n=1 Tax=Halobacillus sp. H74 TaxID=3457436 RepID=UPI003FCCB422
MGAYWFQANVEEDIGPVFRELTVCEGKFVRDRIGSHRYKNLVLDNFVVAPGHVMIDTQEPLADCVLPEKTAENYIKRGCTLLLIQHLVTSLRHYREHYDHFLQKFKQLPLDYMILPVVPVKWLRPELIRFFARKGSPFLCIEVQSREELEGVCWEWLTQAQAYKRIPLTLFVKDTENTSNNYSELWSSLCEQYGMIKLTDMQDDEVVSAQNLRDSGIFPNKGGILPGGQADYNLYWIQTDRTFDEHENFRYHNAVPDVTIMNGQVRQVNQNLTDSQPGTHIKVKIHKHFA